MYSIIIRQFEFLIVLTNQVNTITVLKEPDDKRCSYLIDYVYKQLFIGFFRLFENFAGSFNNDHSFMFMYIEINLCI